jgi:HAE1 family hydrophobic/amphiphilic exporter-1
MFLSKVSIRRPVMMTMIISVFLIFGLMAYFGLSLNLMPEVNIPYVTVQTIYAGSGPVEIETQISKKIEDAVSTISNIDKITSYSMESVSMVMIKFEMEKDIDIATQEVKDKVDAIINDLPSDSDKPKIEKYEIGAQPIMSIVLTGDKTAKELYDIADLKLKDRFSQVPGVAKVNINGGEQREIQVQLKNRTIQETSMPIAQLAQILGAYNMDMPGGSYTKKDQEYSVRFEGQFESVSEIDEVEIPTQAGIKRLGSIAEVKDGSETVKKRSVYFNNLDKVRNENVVTISLIKSSDGNAVELASEIKKKLPEIRKSLPSGVTLEIITDDSIFIDASVQDTLSNIILGVILTGLVLLFFLHDLRSTFIVAMAMPTSIISTFMLMKMAGFTLNIMSLMGLSTAVGVLVANSVVVLENIFRHMELGNRRREASDIGTAETAVAVIASTLTNIVVFLPIGSMSSMAGQFFKEFALTVTFATIFSLFISFTLTPMLASLILPEKKKKNPLGEAFEKMFHHWEAVYRNILKVLLKNKGISLLLIFSAIGAFVFSLLFIAPKLGFEFMPALDEGNISIKAELPQGYNIHETAEILKEIETKIVAHKEVKHVLTILGEKGDTDIGTNMAQCRVKLVDAEDRTRTTSEVNSLLIQDLASISNAKISSSVASSGGGGGDPLEFYLKGPNMERLIAYEKEIREKLVTIPDLINFDTSQRSGKPEITFVPKRKEMVRAGLTVFDLAFTLRASVEGVVAAQYKEDGNEYDIRVQLADSEVDMPEKLNNLIVVSPEGNFRFGQLAELKFTDGVNKVLHDDKAKAIKFSGAPAEGVPMGNVKAEIDRRIATINLEPGYSYSWGGDAEMMQETSLDMARAFGIAILLTYMLLAAILESFVQPFLILGTLPLALIGVFVFMFLTGQTMNIFSMMAIIMLVGIVVNNAILLLDYTKLLIKEKKLSVHDALIEACPTKFKPVMMSSIAIMLGMLPMAMGIGSAGKEFRQSMGIVSIGGLVASTLLTLLIIPAMFYLITKSEHR